MVFSSFLRSRDSRKREEQKWSRSRSLQGGPEGRWWERQARWERDHASIPPAEDGMQTLPQETSASLLLPGLQARTGEGGR